jgi:hypothetical protein
MFGSLGISVVAPYVGAKTALCAKQPPYLGGTTANPKEPNVLPAPGSESSRLAHDQDK